MKGVFEKIKVGMEVADEEFDALFPNEFHEHSNRHYTSVFIAQKAIGFLAEDPTVKILDIGSGTGKFCLIGAATRPNAFTGIEYRSEFVDVARKVAKEYEFKNVDFLDDTVLNVDFSSYDNFYMFNPFLEHKDPSAKMDNTAFHLSDTYEVFRSYVYDQFAQLPVGTRIASYYVGREQFPDSYEQVASYFGDTLRFWQKIR